MVDGGAARPGDRCISPRRRRVRPARRCSAGCSVTSAADPRLGSPVADCQAVVDRDRRGGPAELLAARGGSTIAGLGGVIVTCWRSRRRSLTATARSLMRCSAVTVQGVLFGHRRSVDGRVRRQKLAQRARRPAWLVVRHRRWAPYGVEHVQAVPAHVLRQMRRQEAVLLHGTLPPIHLAVRWWEDRQLRPRAHRCQRRADAPPTTGTCPTSGRVVAPNRCELRSSTSPLPDSRHSAA